MSDHQLSSYDQIFLVGTEKTSQEEVYSLYRSSDVPRVIKSVELGRAGHIARLKDIIC